MSVFPSQFAFWLTLMFNLIYSISLSCCRTSPDLLFFTRPSKSHPLRTLIHAWLLLVGSLLSVSILSVLLCLTWPLLTTFVVIAPAVTNSSLFYHTLPASPSFPSYVTNGYIKCIQHRQVLCEVIAFQLLYHLRPPKAATFFEAVSLSLLC